MYRAYVTESLRLQGENKRLTRPWMELVDKGPKAPEKSGDEIALEVIQAAGLHVESGE